MSPLWQNAPIGSLTGRCQHHPHTAIYAFLPGVTEYIQELRDILYALDSRIQRAKLNVENISQLMEVA